MRGPRVAVRDSHIHALLCGLPDLGLGHTMHALLRGPSNLGLGTHNPRLVVWLILVLGLGTHHPRFVVRG